MYYGIRELPANARRKSFMMEINSISYLCKLLGCESPKHPLISIIDFGSIKTLENFTNITYIQNFYVISLKNGTDCELKYGRKNYDFSEGTLVFTAPGQILATGEGKIRPRARSDGWMLCVHPDLIKGTSLWRKMSNYGYFEYEAYEALHLSDAEKEIVERTIENIKTEYSQNIDTYSRDLILSNLEVLLNYANRFYNRQFITRTTVNKEIIKQFNRLLDEQCSLDILEHEGQPTVKRLAANMGYSPNYLSDMLKKETGKTTQEHIKLKVMELAEDLLRTTNEPIYLIAEKLGFEAPSSFTKFIKSQYGVTPVEFRKQQIG